MGTVSVTTDFDYDSLGRLDTQTDTDQSGNTLAEYDYDVRADGKRAKLTERFAFDHDNDPQTAPVLSDPTTYDWTYDDVGRLTDEVIDHWDDSLDQTESFTYDLTGNRVSLERESLPSNPNDVDEVITYTFDANDRLVTEVLDDLTPANADTTTTYTYDHTQNTSKTVVSAGLTQSRRVFTYNLQGRMNAVVNEGYDAAGVVNSRERASYEYDSKSYRVKLTAENGTGSGDLESETWSLTSATEFLANHHNHTGYTQTIRETTFDDQGAVIKQVDYTFGSDEIAQTVTYEELETLSASSTWRQTDYWSLADNCHSSGQFSLFPSLGVSYDDPDNILMRNIEFLEGLKNYQDSELALRAVEAFHFVTGLASELIVSNSGFTLQIDAVCKQRSFIEFCESLIER